jgi:hypothetical protein
LFPPHSPRTHSINGAHRARARESGRGNRNSIPYPPFDSGVARSGRRPVNLTEAEKEIVKGGGIPEDWQAQPAKLAQKDRDARWTLKRGAEKDAPRRLCHD